MCLACRVRSETGELLRISAHSQKIVLGQRGGRGVYVHPVLECWSKVSGQEKLVARALRLQGDLRWLRDGLQSVRESDLVSAYTAEQR